MTLNLKMVLQVESAAAKAALSDTKTGVDQLGKSTVDLAGKTKAGAGAAAADAAAKRASAAASRELATTNRQAAGATGNLFAQFQDIGVMMAAGQNPLQLAIQQGSQISQVIGPMGAAGAVSALKGAFVQLLNPVNFFTIAAIAAGAATFQWLTGAGEEARTFEDAVADLSTRADAYIKIADRARASTADLRKEFGEASVAARELLKDMAERELRETQRAAAQASQDMQSQLGVFDGAEFGTSNQKNLADLFDLSVWSRDAQKEINTVLGAFKALDQAGTLDQQIAAAEQLRASFLAAAQASGDISAAEDAVLAPLEAMILKLISVRETQAGTTAEIGASRTAAEGLDAVAGNLLATLSAAAGVNLSGVFSGAFGAADTLLGKANAILAVAGQALAEFGATQNAMKQSSRNYGKILNKGESGPDIARREMLPLNAKITTGTLGKGAAGVRVPSTGSGTGSSGAGAAKAEADAVQELIAKLQGEVDSLRILDPLQKEMLQYRDQLAGATEAERAKVEALIAAREREKAQLETIAELQQFGEGLVENALDALITKGESLQDVLKGVIAALAKAAIQAAIFGSGPLGGLFGGKGIGSLIFGGGKAAGGMVHGPGTGTSDSILTPLSNGEYIVNARATARNRHLLEAINAGGSIGGMAAGGPVGGRGREASGRSGGRDSFHATFDMKGARGDREIEARAYEGMKRALREYDRNALPKSVARVSRDPRKIG